MKTLCTPTLAALAMAAAFAGCGDDEDKGGGDASSEPEKVALQLKPAGKKAEVTAPKSVRAGVVSLDFENATKKEGGLQLIRIRGDHTGKEALKAGNAWGDKGRPLPGWIGLEGGVPTTRPGASKSVTQTLKAGKYLAVSLETNAYAEFEVTGDGAGRPEAPAARIDATEYSFKATGLKPGKSEVVFDNKGGQPHFVAALPMNPGATIQDVRTFLKEEKGKPPFSEEGAFDTPVSDGGRSQVFSVDLEKGKYAMACFIPDRQGGPPHVVKGMVSEATVK